MIFLQLRDSTIKVDELKWIWAKEYHSEIRTIEFKTLKSDEMTAKDIYQS